MSFGSNGQTVFAKCQCKAGQGGCCKHVAALLYTLLDYSNLQLKYVPDDVTCTQVLQKWSIPNRKLSANFAVKFNGLEFEKSNFARDNNKTRTRPLVKGDRMNYCTSPPFAKVSSDEIKKLSDTLAQAGKATIFSKTL